MRLFLWSMVLLTSILLILLTSHLTAWQDHPTETLLYAYALPSGNGTLSLGSPDTPLADVILHTTWLNGSPAISSIHLGQAMCITRPDGVCSVRLPAGTYMVFALAEGSRLIRQNFTIQKQGEVTLTLRPAQRITCSGEYIHGRLSHAYPEAQGTWLQCNTTYLPLYDPRTLRELFLPLANGSLIRVEGWLTEGRGNEKSWQRGIYAERVWQITPRGEK